MKRINKQVVGKRMGTYSRLPLVIVAAGLLFGWSEALAIDENVPAIKEHSRFVTEIPVVKNAEAKWLAFPILPDMFDGGRWDLSDLRLLDAGDNIVPYAIRVRKAYSKRQSVAASTFNRAESPDGVTELSLDLGESPVEHNEVEVQTAGSEFRRQATLEGSEDGKTWNRLAETQLLRFHRANDSLEDDRIQYPASRFRYLRVRVEQDSGIDKEPVNIREVVVRHTVEVPGELITREAKLGTRQTSRQEGVSGSWWPVDLGGSRVPCQRLDVEIRESEFVRNYLIAPLPEDGGSSAIWVDVYGSGRYAFVAQSDDPAGPKLSEAFVAFPEARSEWRRRFGDPLLPLVADLGHVRAGRLRLFIADSANEPLTVTSVKYVAPACLVVFANSPELRGPLKAYFGNAKAEAPNYDFARNLPPKLDPPPARLAASERQGNDAYIPPPLPFTERFRWLIHCTLGLVSLLLAALVAQLARKVVVRHDGHAATESPAA